MGYPSVKPYVMRFMLANPGRPITKEEIAIECELTPDQVNSAIGNLIREDKVEGLTRVVRGSIYRYDTPESTANGSETPAVADAPEEPEDGPWYEQVGTAASGAQIVRGPDGTLYRLEVL